MNRMLFYHPFMEQGAMGLIVLAASMGDAFASENVTYNPEGVSYAIFEILDVDHPYMEREIEDTYVLPAPVSAQSQDLLSTTSIPRLNGLEIELFDRSALAPDMSFLRETRSKPFYWHNDEQIPRGHQVTDMRSPIWKDHRYERAQLKRPGEYKVEKREAASQPQVTIRNKKGIERVLPKRKLSSRV